MGKVGKTVCFKVELYLMMESLGNYSGDYLCHVIDVIEEKWQPNMRIYYLLVSTILVNVVVLSSYLNLNTLKVSI